jgi:hypothetical protein
MQAIWRTEKQMISTILTVFAVLVAFVGFMAVMTSDDDDRKPARFAALAAVVVLLSASSSIVGIKGCNRGYSEGDRIGIIVKLSNKGLFYKSWEGEMNLGGSTTNGVVPSTFDFTLTDTSLVAPIEAAILAGARMKLHYVAWYQAPILRLESDYEIVSITAAPEVKP